MIDTTITDSINEMNTAEADAMGDTIPGYQAKFHQAMSAHSESTGVEDPLSVSAPDGEFFIVQRADGSRGYSRAGTFTIQDRYVLTAQGDRLMGYPPGQTSGKLVPITVPPNTPDGWVHIAANGTMSVVDPKVVEKLDYAGHLDPPPLAQMAAPPPGDNGKALQHATNQKYHQANGTSSSASIAAPDGSTATGFGGAGQSDPMQSSITQSGPNPWGPANQSPSTSTTANPWGAANQSTANAANKADSQNIGATFGGLNSQGAANEQELAVLQTTQGSGKLASPQSVLSGQAISGSNNAQGSLFDGTPSTTNGSSSYNTSAQAGAFLANPLTGVSNTDPLAAARLHAQTQDLGSHVKSPIMTGEALGSNSPVIGRPFARIAMAEFAAGTIVDQNGNASSSTPTRVHVPDSNTCKPLKTYSRDMGNVDIYGAVTGIDDAGTRLNAVMAAEQSSQGRIKKAMDLIK